jgi:hypothetical protein
MSNLNQIIRKVIKEATSQRGGAAGQYVTPIQPGFRPFNETELTPYTQSVSKYDNPLVQYDSLDHKMDLRQDQIKKLEDTARKITNFIKKHPDLATGDDDGNVINQYMYDHKTPKKNSQMRPFTEKVKFNEWVNLSFDNLISESDTINEDLAVWFGTKKKPKGSKQPKGPWVNICRKVDGKHPPCGRHDTSKGSYPKCRAAGVAGKMSDSAKKAACQQKRTAEKKDTQTGKGQKPIMTSYKPKK